MVSYVDTGKEACTHCKAGQANGIQPGGSNSSPTILCCGLTRPAAPHTQSNTVGLPPRQKECTLGIEVVRNFAGVRREVTPPGYIDDLARDPQKLIQHKGQLDGAHPRPAAQECRLLVTWPQHQHRTNLVWITNGVMALSQKVLPHRGCRQPRHVSAYDTIWDALDNEGVPGLCCMQYPTPYDTNG